MTYYRSVGLAVLGTVISASWSVDTAAAQLPTKPAGPVTSAPTTTSTTAYVRIRELRCRGARGGLAISEHANPSPRSPSYATMVALRLVYQRADSVPDWDWWKLPPGACSWNDPHGPREPGEVIFDVLPNAQLKQKLSGVEVDTSPTAAELYPDAHTIPAYLSDPNHYWVFYVPESGPPIALSHTAKKISLSERAITAPLAGGLPTTRDGALDPTRPASDGLPTRREMPAPLGTTRIGDPDTQPQSTTDITARWAVHDVVATPSLNNVVIRFVAGPTAPSVQVSASAPIREPSTGRWFFEPPMTNLRVSRKPSGSAWAYAAIAAIAPALRGTTFHYLIDAPAQAGTDAHQVTGTFTTWTQNAKVVFEELHILNDADHGFALDGEDAGEIDFIFYGGVGTPSYERRQIPPRDYNDGDRVRLGPELSFTVSPAEDRFRIVVRGYERDDCFSDPGASARSKTFDWITGVGAEAPENDCGGSLNFATGEFNLAQVPGTSGVIPFTLRSFPNGNELAFEVTGHIEVSRR
jgi:hypothetical protein